LDTLTGDERMAVELYQAIKKSRRAPESVEEEQEEKVAAGQGETMVNTYNNAGDALQEVEEEKRAITYQIAKNKASTYLHRRQEENK
jgi:hypothetical protein